MSDLHLVDVESCREAIKQALPSWDWNNPEHDPLFEHPFEQVVRPALRLQFEIIAQKDAEIERLKKVAEQAIALANIRLEYRTAHDDPEGDDHPYVCCDSCGTPFLSALAAYLKEKENG